MKSLLQKLENEEEKLPPPFPQMEFIKDLKASDQKKSKQIQIIVKNFKTLKEPRSYQCFDPDKYGWVTLRFLDKDFQQRRYQRLRKTLHHANKKGLSSYVFNLVSIREIVPVRNPEEDRLSCYITIEEDTGISLQDYLESREKPFIRTEVEQMCYQIARAVGLLHSSKLAHGDLRAQNFIIQTQQTLKPIIKLGALYNCTSVNREGHTTSFTGTVNRVSPYMPLEKAGVVHTGAGYFAPYKVDAWYLGLLFTQIVLSGTKLRQFKKILAQNSKLITEKEFKILLAKINKLLQQNCKFEALKNLILNGLLKLKSRDRIDALSALKWLKSMNNSKKEEINLEEEAQLAQERKSMNREILLAHQQKY